MHSLDEQKASSSLYCMRNCYALIDPWLVKNIIYFLSCFVRPRLSIEVCALPREHSYGVIDGLTQYTLNVEILFHC